MQRCFGMSFTELFIIKSRVSKNKRLGKSDLNTLQDTDALHSHYSKWGWKHSCISLSNREKIQGKTVMSECIIKTQSWDDGAQCERLAQSLDVIEVPCVVLQSLALYALASHFTSSANSKMYHYQSPATHYLAGCHCQLCWQKNNYLVAILWPLGKCLHLYLLYLPISGVYMHKVHAEYAQMCLDACVCLCFKACLQVVVCPHVTMNSSLCVRGVREKSPSQCMTLSNWLCIKLMTTKTFSGLKSIYTPTEDSLMSALKSTTTNSPWRKSLAHRGCSGCLSLGVFVWVCVRMCACVLTIRV